MTEVLEPFRKFGAILLSSVYSDEETIGTF